MTIQLKGILDMNLKFYLPISETNKQTNNTLLKLFSHCALKCRDHRTGFHSVH